MDFALWIGVHGFCWQSIAAGIAFSLEFPDTFSTPGSLEPRGVPGFEAGTLYTRFSTSEDSDFGSSLPTVWSTTMLSKGIATLQGCEFGMMNLYDSW